MAKKKAQAKKKISNSGSLRSQMTKMMKQMHINGRMM